MMASDRGSALGRSNSSNPCPQTSHVARGSHARWTNALQCGQNLPSLENTIPCSQTLHLLPAICMKCFSKCFMQLPVAYPTGNPPRSVHFMGVLRGSGTFTDAFPCGGSKI